jgi:heme/copper-type cytochrome/quinol oxidase subunit 2
MSVLNTIVLAAEEAKIALFFPAWVFPLIAVAVFVALGFVVWSFRDVANRHSQKTGGSAASGHTTDH